MLDVQALQHKLALEANRVGELEGLLSGMRTNQFKSTFSEQHSADKAGSLQARNTLLTQQASLMHSQSATALCNTFVCTIWRDVLASQISEAGLCHEWTSGISLV